MSKLTNCQIIGVIASLEASLAGAISRGDSRHAGFLRTKLDRYEKELKDRREARLDPGTEIQESHIK